MRKIKLTPSEKKIEASLLKGEYAPVDKREYLRIAQAVAERRKDAVLNLRMNSQDLQHIKEKAKKLGIKYQTFISEILRQIAQSS